MERIENILRRLQEVYYSRHEKTGIDIDLMLDYTRVMYADLLEWRKRFGDDPMANPVPATAQPEAAAEPATAAGTAKAQQPEAAPPAVPRPEQPAAAAKPEQPETAVAETEQPQAAAEAPQAPTDRDKKPEGTIAGTEKEEAEAGVIQEVMHNNSSAISFEPPAPRASHPTDIEDVLAEEEPEVNMPVENIVLPEVEPLEEASAAPPVPEAAQQSKGPVLRKDIRGAIGINDKYLFLNELFGNNKTDYEETLDQLRLFDDYEQAYKWLQEHPARKNSWEEGDDTVQSFLALVSQYLSSR